MTRIQIYCRSGLITSIQATMWQYKSIHNIVENNSLPCIAFTLPVGGAAGHLTVDLVFIALESKSHRQSWWSYTHV